MRACEVCENAHDEVFEIVLGGRSHLFDSFECAIHALYPSTSGAGTGPQTDPGRTNTPTPDGGR